MRVLVIDDEEALRMLLVRHLKRRGHEVVEFASGDEAIRLLFGDSYFGHVFTDKDMQGSEANGLDVLRFMVQDPALSAVTRTLISGDSDPRLAEQAKMLGATFYSRPVDYKKMFDELGLL